VLLALLLCGPSGCRERDAHATTERIFERGTLRAGLAAEVLPHSGAELALLEGIAASLGARVEPFPAPLSDLSPALAAGVIDLVLISSLEEGRGAAAALTPEGTVRLGFTLEGREASLLVRAGEQRFLALCRRLVTEAALSERPATAHP
jgi:ABC-type amino acid transport substrate-binding protein